LHKLELSHRPILLRLFSFLSFFIGETMRVLLFPFLLLALMACQSQQETNTFTYASSGEFKPFSYVDESGELQGYDIAVGREIARRLKREPKAVKYKFT